MDHTFLIIWITEMHPVLHWIGLFVSSSGCFLNFEMSGIILPSCCVFSISISFIGNVFCLRKVLPKFLKTEVLKLWNVRIYWNYISIYPIDYILKYVEITILQADVKNYRWFFVSEIKILWIPWDEKGRRGEKNSYGFFIVNLWCA